MGLYILKTFGKLFKGIILGGVGLWKILFTRVGLAGLVGWRWLIFLSIVILFLGNSISMSIQQDDPSIIIKDLGSIIMSTDSAIENETRRVQEQGDSFGAVQWLLSYFKILSSIYMVYFWYFIGFKMTDFIYQQSAPMGVKLLFSTIFIMLIRNLYVSLMIGTGQLSFQEDFDGNYLRLLLPYYGVFLFFKNIHLWTQPILAIGK